MMYGYVVSADGCVLDEDAMDTELDCASIDEAEALVAELAQAGIDATIVVIC